MKNTCYLFACLTPTSVWKQPSPSLTGPKGNGLKLKQGFCTYSTSNPSLLQRSTSLHLKRLTRQEQQRLVVGQKVCEKKLFSIRYRNPDQKQIHFWGTKLTSRAFALTLQSTVTSSDFWMRPSGKQVQTENRSRTGQTALSETDQEPQGPTVGTDRYWEILKMIPGMTPVKSVLKSFDAGQRIIHTVTCNTPKHTRAHTHTPCSRGLKRRKTDCSIQHLILHADKDRNCPLCVSPTPSVCVTHSFLFHNSFSIQI